MSERKRLGDLISEVPGQITSLLKAEIANLKAEVTGKVKGIGIGAVLLIVAVVFALYMVGWLFAAGFHAWQLLFPEWAAALLTAASLLVIILILAIPGALLVMKNVKFGEMRSVGSIKEDVNMARGLGHAADGTSPLDDLDAREDLKAKYEEGDR